MSKANGLGSQGLVCLNFNKIDKIFLKSLFVLLAIFIFYTKYNLALAEEHVNLSPTIEKSYSINKPVVSDSKDENNQIVEQKQEVKSTETKKDSIKDPEIENPQAQSRGTQSSSNAFAQTIYSDAKQLKPEVDSNLGALKLSYPVIVPPGRNGLSPDIKIEYNSQNKENNSPFGYGWRINIPTIQKINKKGINKLYSSDVSEWFLSSSMAGELALVSTSTSSTTAVFISRSDDGSFLKYNLKSDNSISVFDKAGTEYIYGSSTSTRQDNPLNSSEIYKWMLSSVKDTNGNSIVYSYSKNQGQIYPSSISYGGIYTITFSTTTRSDIFNNFETGFSVTTASNISEINIYASSTLRSKISFTYGVGDNGVRSLLKASQVSGYDDQSNLIIEKQAGSSLNF